MHIPLIIHIHKQISKKKKKKNMLIILKFGGTNNLIPSWVETLLLTL